MDYLRPIGALVFLAVAAIGLVQFNRHCEKKFSFTFFSIRQFMRLIIAVTLLFMGGAISLRHGPEAESIGLVVLFAGGGVLWWALFDNFRKTNVRYGFLGTIFQLGIFVTFVASGMFVALMLGAIVFVCLSAIQPVFVVNRK